MYRRKAIHAVLGAAAGAFTGATAIRAEKRKRNKPSGPQPPEVRIAEFRVQRDGGLISVEGRIVNGSQKPFKGLVLYFEFLEFNGRMISRKNTEVTENTIGPGEDSEFTTQTPDQVRAVHVRIDAEDKDGRYLTVDKPGPYVIE